MSGSPDDIVGHKTLSTGETGPDGFPVVCHEPITRAEADAILAECDRADAARREKYPDEQSAIRAIQDGWLRLKELGWKEARYAPKPTHDCQVIEVGSTGIHWASRDVNGDFCVYDAGDAWPSDPILYRIADPLKPPA